MKESAKTKAELTGEISFLKERIKELEQSESERQQVVERLLREKAFSDMLLDTLNETVFLYEAATGKPLRWNKRFVEMSGYHDEEIAGMKAPDDFYKKDVNKTKDASPLLLFARNGTVEMSLVTKRGTHIPFEYSETAIISPDGKSLILSIGRDLTRRKRTEEALRSSEKRYRVLSILDNLTQLYNYRHFYHQLKMETNRVNRYGQPLTLLLLDLDGFKAFNDTYGHVEGDKVLQRFGQVVRRCLRQTDSAYRYGGDEFTVLLPMTTTEEGLITAERIRTEFKNENLSPAPGEDIHLTISAGIAQYEPREDIKVFVQRVDQLMYAAKKYSKDRVYSDLYLRSSSMDDRPFNPEQVVTL